MVLLCNTNQLNRTASLPPYLLVISHTLLLNTVCLYVIRFSKDLDHSLWSQAFLLKNKTNLLTIFHLYLCRLENSGRGWNWVVSIFQTPFFWPLNVNISRVWSNWWIPSSFPYQTLLVNVGKLANSLGDFAQEMKNICRWFDGIEWPPFFKYRFETDEYFSKIDSDVWIPYSVSCNLIVENQQELVELISIGQLILLKRNRNDSPWPAFPSFSNLETMKKFNGTIGYLFTEYLVWKTKQIIEMSPVLSFWSRPCNKIRNVCIYQLTISFSKRKCCTIPWNFRLGR